MKTNMLNRMLFKYFSLVVLGAVFGISGCSTLNVIDELGLGEKTGSTDIVIIERYPDEPFISGIKRFRHHDLGFSKKAPASFYNNWHVWKRILTPPGHVEVGLIGGLQRPILVDFDAEAGQHYYTTVSCPAMSPCAVVIDANTNRIIASTCKNLVDTKLDRCNECFWLGGAARNIPTGLLSPLVLRRIPDECRSK
jgi:hypothetical protein